jgi:hypothetical protein
MTPLEIIAIIFAFGILVKLVFVHFKPQSWMNFAEKIYHKNGIAALVYLVLIVIVGYYVFQVMNIVHIISVMTLTALLMGLTFLLYAPDFMKLGRKMMKSSVRFWPISVLWALIALYTLYVVFT